MNWQFWKQGSKAAATRREIESLRNAHVQTQARIIALEQENAEAWEVLAVLWDCAENPDTGFFGRLRLMLSPHAEKLKQASARMRKEKRP